eukprot:4497141-Prorocentrum_lima.AAC.1
MGKLLWADVARVRAGWMQGHVELLVGVCRKGVGGVSLSTGGARNPHREMQVPLRPCIVVD